VEVAYIVFLLEYCAQGIGGGICIHYKGFGEVWLAKHWGGGNPLFKGIKSALSFFHPIPFDVFMGQLIEGSCNTAKVPNPVVIE
jgi:hypothetical protein